MTENRMDLWHQSPYSNNKPCKSKILKIEDNVFDIGVMRHATQFTESLLIIADYVWIKYNSYVTEAIGTIWPPDFNYPKKPMVTYMKEESGKVMGVKPHESDVFMWRKLWEKENDCAFELKKHHKTISSDDWTMLAGTEDTA